MNAAMNNVDGNAATDELSRIFAVDITRAEGQRANCGAKKHFAEAHLYVECPEIVARCAGCGHVLRRLVTAGGRLLLDLRGMTLLAFDTSEFQNLRDRQHVDLQFPPC